MKREKKEAGFSVLFCLIITCDRIVKSQDLTAVRRRFYL